MAKHLVLTLGHNSSAAVVDDETGKILIGYEEERLTRIKSDSAFPHMAIDKCLDHTGEDYKNIYISHWFEDLLLTENKWCDAVWLSEAQYKHDIISMDPDMTHHDAHAWSAVAFKEEHRKDQLDYDVIVCDGFGNNKEVISHYYYIDGEIILKERISGYENSLGLLYQYATSFCGMKENQDEYKFLGYKAQIEFIKYDKTKINRLIDLWVDGIETSDLYNFNTLKECKREVFYAFFHNCMEHLEEQHYPHAKRIFMGYIVQSIVERYLTRFIAKREIKNVILAGGVFYNVKLNNKIMKQVKNICVMPLAGDSGAGFGVYYHDQRKLTYGDLCYGRREAYTVVIDKTMQKEIVNDILNNKIINLVKGDMEFGPRALCNTSTLALPTKQNVDRINKANGRNTIMPMAPVMTEEVYKDMFARADRDKIIGSHKFMIMTLEYLKLRNKLMGVSHRITNSSSYSGRSQVIFKDNPIYDIVHVCGGILINTSFNMHGNPIVYDEPDVNGFKTYEVLA